MFTQSIFRNVFPRFSSRADLTSIVDGGKKFINKNFYPSRFILLNSHRSSCFLGGEKNVKMRLTFMVVFFTIYNAQSQRKRKFSCINQKKAPWKNCEREKEKCFELVFLRDVFMWTFIDRNENTFKNFWMSSRILKTSILSFIFWENDFHKNLLLNRF